MMAACSRLAALTRAAPAVASVRRAAMPQMVRTLVVSARSPLRGQLPQRWVRLMSTEGKKPIAPVSWKSMAVILVVGGAIISYFQLERDKMKQEVEAKKSQSVGQTLIGGPFALVDTTGKEVTDGDFRGKWLLLYFGFTFCPDICPEELVKIGEVVDLHAKREDKKGELLPVFISVDPKRDSPKKIATYLKDFHPSFVGLTGTEAQLKTVTKAFRVYYSAPTSDPNDTDYLVDHSIMTYLIDPEGKFAAYYGQNALSKEISDKIALTSRVWKPSE